MKLGTYIKLARGETAQKEIAIKANVSPQFLHDLETNRRTPSDNVLDTLQSILGFDRDFAYMLLGKLPPDLRNNVTKAKMSKAYRIMREK